MTFSKLISGTIPHHDKYSSRNGNPIARVLQHHHATVGEGGTNALTDPNAQKSVTYNIKSDGTIWGQVPEEYRPWTSGSAAADDPSITIEVQNVSEAVNGNDDDPSSWKISQLAYNSIVKLVADIAQRHRFADIDVTTYMGHRQVGQTACPGGFLWHRMGETRRLAKEYRASGKLGTIVVPAAGTIKPLSPITKRMIELGDFEKLVLGKYINVDNAYGAQCWDLFGFFTDWLKIPRINTQGGVYSGWAGAIWDQYGKNGAEKYFNRVSPDQPVVQGDTLIWGPVPGLYPATHIAQGVEDAGSSVWVLSQNSSPSLPGNPYPNDSTGPVVKQLLPKTGLLGMLRHKSVTASGVIGTSIAQLADEVLAGKHGNGDDRIRSLGVNYDAVQLEIDRRLGAAPVRPAVTIGELADRVLRGEFGDGDARRQRLGANYDAVQAEINRRSGVPAPGKTISQLADEVLAGKHGDGPNRQRSLGVNYNAVQAEINRRFGAPAPAPNTINALVDRTLRGEFGDGPTRQRLLGANYAAVQAEINRRFS